ncbi:MAG: DUF1624 domain-containing protein [Saprospiraceae bacterium]|nr:DUF1624 domain-containing protein [Saprospiraceae bacterium]
MTETNVLQPVAQHRIYSIDVLRGLVMVIMALDHTRDFFHAEAFTRDPLDPATTNILMYFTRFITHFCAPVFILLAGTSIYLQSLRKSKSELSAFLFKRGLWLILVEVILITFAWTFDFSYSIFILQVIWAIGICMVLMGIIIRLPYTLILIAGLAIVFGHNILDVIPSTHQGFWWDLLHNGNFAFHEILPGHQITIIYPFLPWLGLMMLGYCSGKIYEPSVNPAFRKKLLLYTGTGLILFFILLRYINVYGDPLPWTLQDNTTSTVFSFLNVHKYPPSLLFMCITIGPALIFLALFETTQNKITRIISVYGKVPFFYYILHFYILHILCMILFLARGHSFSEGIQDTAGIPFRFLIAGEGYSIGIVYLIWILMVIALYPLCKWFSDMKRKHRHWWLSYL